MLLRELETLLGVPSQDRKVTLQLSFSQTFKFEKLRL